MYGLGGRSSTGISCTRVRVRLAAAAIFNYLLLSFSLAPAPATGCPRSRCSTLVRHRPRLSVAPCTRPRVRTACRHSYPCDSDASRASGRGEIARVTRVAVVTPLTGSVRSARDNDKNYSRLGRAEQKCRAVSCARLACVARAYVHGIVMTQCACDDYYDDDGPVEKWTRRHRSGASVQNRLIKKRQRRGGNPPSAPRKRLNTIYYTRPTDIPLVSLRGTRRLVWDVHSGIRIVIDVYRALSRVDKRKSAKPIIVFLFAWYFLSDVLRYLFFVVWYGNRITNY